MALATPDDQTSVELLFKTESTEPSPVTWQNKLKNSLKCAPENQARA